MHKMSTHFRDNLWKNSFDPDSHPLMFDDGASASITNDLQDFIWKPTPIDNMKSERDSGKCRSHVPWDCKMEN